ncbi:tetratricopeptide repeat protein, partial [Desulfosarcina sp. OttesenSCG-928-A07]|nr:tetratricopeptide repeat protein [Desulfosarcina sp. OttesenSCG-928-G17]MDL2330291.1 tetratricopeptide repeat protein [Desulfosarcina sp. OttesenSCG-928-A07]
HPSTGTSYNNIGLVYEHQGEYEKALEEFLRAYHIFSTQLRKNHPHTQLVYKNMADAYAKSGNQADFSVWLEQALGEKTGSPE